MRTLLVVLVLFCVGCNYFHMKMPEYRPAHSRKVAVKLMDSLGIVTMYVPERYDTAFSWIHGSDCSSCDKMKCRFQSSLWRVYKESGWFFYPPTDSVDRVTIIYSPHLYLGEGDTAWIYGLNKEFRKQKKIEDSVVNNIFIDTLCRVYDRPFYITGTHFYSEMACREFYELNAVSSVRGMDITFQFELITTKDDSLSKHFLQNAMNVLKTIRFTKPI
ncbi:hypothetical protein [Chitinophaga filiformis]|uniref:Uncharacterized protein n=1 Tax=Chitinophaga filiformis TaxID=104663 RepID=A0A1G7YU58_CHIFI|nr:hypothetical protein [Chitinophaga filiformis]SDH00001.1 hypothetical protein SAMN04488121_1087 [Chitinophaga filiformis]